jgi:hypothetical protein
VLRTGGLAGVAAGCPQSMAPVPKRRLSFADKFNLADKFIGGPSPKKYRPGESISTGRSCFQVRSLIQACQEMS